MINGISVGAIEVRHACGAPALGLRLSCEGKTIAYSGDSEWTDALIDVGRDADLFIVETFSFEKRVKQHLDYATLRANMHRIGAKRIVLTHLGPEMLARLSEVEHEAASDGLLVEI
jgi:ribonuclease BN (tRNA processing enzyme)